MKDCWRSRQIFGHPEKLDLYSYHKMRALFKSMGYTDSDLDRPRIGVANSWGELSPGHHHLRGVADAVKAGIWQAGGTPLEFNSFAQCGALGAYCAIGAGLNFMTYDTPTRDIVAAEVEAAAQLHLFDAMVMISTCDKNVPAHLLAAARVDIPTIIVPGGPMQGGVYHGRKVTAGYRTFSELIKTYKDGKISDEDLSQFEDSLCPGAGGCQDMGTANTMQCLAEAVGMTLPYAATAPAVSAKRLRIAKESGRQIMKVFRQCIRPSDIMSKEAIENMIRVLLAIGGSTNAVLHILALKEELGLENAISLDTFDRLSREIPCICAVKPSGAYDTCDLDEAGGIPGVMKELKPLLYLDALTVTGKSLKENLTNVDVWRPEVIRPLTDPVYKEGLAVLRGNLAKSAIARPTAIPKNMLRHKGPAKVFDRLTEAVNAIKVGKIIPGDVVVIRYEGPRGGPGMPDAGGALTALLSVGLETSCYVITDAKFSGLSGIGPGVCQVSPEAMSGGPIAVVRDGDLIEVEIEQRKLNVKLSDEEIKRRLVKWKPPEPKIKKGFLTVYAQIGEPAEKGGGICLRL